MRDTITAHDATNNRTITISVSPSLMKVLTRGVPDELRVLDVCAHRIERGRESYGDLVVAARSSKQWRAEKAEETADRLVYDLIAELAELDA